MRRILMAMALPFLGCTGTDSMGGGACEDLCMELVGVCSYEAFPDMTSCLDGCAFDASEGQDVEAQAACVEEAVCDTFAILECQNQSGS